MAGSSTILESIRKSNFSKTVVVGVAATLADMGSLVLMIQAFGFKPQVANLPSLMVGSCTQFFGNRHFVFKATGGSFGQFTGQVASFAAGEFIAFSLNALIFHVLVTYTPIHYAIARILGSFTVFVGFSYPLWRKIFRPMSQ